MSGPGETSDCCCHEWDQYKDSAEREKLDLTQAQN